MNNRDTQQSEAIMTYSRVLSSDFFSVLTIGSSVSETTMGVSEGEPGSSVGGGVITTSSSGGSPIQSVPMP
jgi:hypothetical protein